MHLLIEELDKELPQGWVLLRRTPNTDPADGFLDMKFTSNVDPFERIASLEVQLAECRTELRISNSHHQTTLKRLDEVGKQLAECQEKYEHLHQGKTLMEDAWCSPQEHEELLRELADCREKCRLIEEENKLLDAFKASWDDEEDGNDDTCCPECGSPVIPGDHCGSCGKLCCGDE